jgi:tetratricopeptide (TPR) repeat protein
LSGPHDVFICHDPASAATVKRLTAALAARGVSCFNYEGGHGSDLHPKLTTSKSFLVWASEGFFRSRACQTHLAMAWIARQREATSTPERILVVNAETGLKHIYPLQLRDYIIPPTTDQSDTPDIPALAEKLHQCCARLDGTLGGLYPQAHAGWIEPYDTLTHGPVLFAGRERELWDIHDGLTHPSMGVHGHSPSFIVVSAPPGLGKSTLTREYAFRFSAAYPGGIFRISARGATPALRLRELAENPALAPQLLSLLRQISPDTQLDEQSPLAAVMTDLGDLLDRAGQPFLWIVDDLPEGINGPVIQQWLAPTAQNQSPRLGRTIFVTCSPRYDHRGEPIHLPILDEAAGLLAITQNKATGRGEDMDAANWLSEAVGRHPRFIAMMAALAEGHRRHRRATFNWLLQKLEKKNKPASEFSQHWPGQFPESRETACAAMILESLRALGGAGRDILRLAAELGDTPLPLDFLTECLILSGLSADDRKEDLFTIFLNEPQEVPLSTDAARLYVEEGASSLVKHGLATRTDNALQIYELAGKAINQVVTVSPRQLLLKESALQALYIIAESCHASRDWRRLDALAAHGRKLTEDLRDRPIEAEDSAAEVTGRIRLAIHLADLDLMHGASRRAMQWYRAASAYLVRAMAIDPQNGARQRDFARIQEQLGDLLVEQKDSSSALDHYRKSLGIRTFIAKQETLGQDRLRDALRLNIKIGSLQKELGDVEGALQSQQAVHGLIGKLHHLASEDSSLEFDLASSHADLAELNIALKNSETAMTQLEHALAHFEKLAEAQPQQVRFARAPAATHNRIGDILRAKDDLSGALNRYRTALAIAENTAHLQPDNPEWQRDVALCHKNLGDTLNGLDDPAEADHHFQRFLLIAENPAHQSAFDGIHRRDIATVLIKLGRSRELEKNITAALARYQTARGIIEKLAIEFPENSLLREDLGWLRHKIERLTERHEADLRRLARAQAGESNPAP